jgi:hypothetical protein
MACMRGMQPCRRIGPISDTDSHFALVVSAAHSKSAPGFEETLAAVFGSASPHAPRVMRPRSSIEKQSTVGWLQRAKPGSAALALLFFARRAPA